MIENTSKTSILQETITKESIEKSQVHLNLAEGFIITTEDKIKLCLIEYLKFIEKKFGWITPLGLLIMVVLTFLTTDFKDWIVSKYTWQATFLITGVIFLGWLLYCIYISFKVKTIDDIIGEIKKSSRQLSEKDKEREKNLPPTAQGAGERNS